ncbi:gamma-secretase-activating protein isoform X1 [Bufo gargarizans]|uniref:gamma-secretase-activating protein isoform X1 n=1 Tax=Bufo gargarizans TaxID=30331 RepID=UPI001CF484E3|nr:gamma-secretase-activating protein isoform X1 [Bufo gargarizans]
MLLDFQVTFNLHRDVLPWVSTQGSPVSDTLEKTSRTLRIINVERDGNVLYTWKGVEGFANVGLYDALAKQNELLYSFDSEVNIISASVNSERTLLALSYCHPTCETQSRVLSPGSRYLGVLIEIKPINNVKVLKAVDGSIRVQFLCPDKDVYTFNESYLLVVSEEKYIDQFHISIGKEDGKRVVIKNTGQIPKDRIVEDFVWAQWDVTDQMLFYIVPKFSSCVLHCIQFHSGGNFTFMLEIPLEISLADQGVSLVNLGYDPPEERGRGKIVTQNLQVFTNKTGGLCLFYYQPPKVLQELTYMVFLLHKGCSKTFKVSTTMTDPKHLKKVSFINIDSYVAVYLPDQFLHLINTRHPELMCYHFFLAAEDARISGMCCDCPLQTVLKTHVVECCTGILFSVSINQEQLLTFLTESRRDCERLAALHCFLLHLDLQPQMETQLIEWICDNLSTCLIFDPIQEFVIASLHRYLSLESMYLDKLLPYTSMPFWSQNIDGISCTSDITDMPILKAGIFKGFWKMFYCELEHMKQAQQRFLYINHMPRRDWCRLISEVDTVEKRNDVYQRNVLENAKKVLRNMSTRKYDGRIVPLNQEEDYLQKDLMGLMMVKLKDHLSQHLHHVAKNKIEKIVLDFVCKQLDLVSQILEVVWRKHILDPDVLCLDRSGSSSEYFAFHVMCRITDATSRMCMPLPPGFQTLHLVLAVRCLPLGNLLHYIDAGVLTLTETFVVKLFKELDDNKTNEKLKCSIILRLPENICEKVHNLWDYATSNNVIAMKYVKKLLFRVHQREVSQRSPSDRSPLTINFLPLNYLIMMLSELEDRALNPFEEDNIDAAFLGEIALKQTADLLRL